MSAFKDFERKVRNREFSLTHYTSTQKRVETCKQMENESEQAWDSLNKNISDADAAKYLDGYFAIYSTRKYIGGFIVFLKKAVRKLIKIFGGWYLFPIYERQSYFNGKIVNSVAIEREILVEVRKKIEELYSQQTKVFNQLNEKEKTISILREENLKVHEQSDSLQKALQSKEHDLSLLQEENMRLNELLNGMFKQFAQLTQRTSHIETEIDKLNNLPSKDDNFYHEFEEKFRGSQDMIRERLRVYVPKLKEHLQDWSQGTFVDVGSGRGEWLDILRENGAIDYVGIDLNARQNAICAEKGHRVLQMDCIEYLASLPENSVDLVTGFQIIEHLCMSDLMTLLKESYRVLKQGGMILFETQNPRNVVVGAGTFYIDPSHKRPLDPGMVSFLAEWCGYQEVTYIDANSDPNWESLELPDQNIAPKEYRLIKEFNAIKWLLYGPQDYAVFGMKE